jgi:membrane protein
MKQILQMTCNAFGLWQECRSATMGAAIAYYTMFSIPALLVIALAVASQILGQEAATGQLAKELQRFVGEEVATAMQRMISKDHQAGGGPMAILVGIALLLFGASGVFVEIQTSLNLVWQVQPKAGRGLMGIIKDRAVSFLMVLGSSLLLLASLIISTTLSLIARWWPPESMPGGTFLWPYLHALMSLILITMLFAILYRILPDAKIGWSEVWLGALFTALLFLVGKEILGVYLAHSNIASGYGAAGSLMVVLVWVYYSSQIFLLGAAFTRVYALHHGNRGEPMEHAEPLKVRPPTILSSNP